MIRLEQNPNGFNFLFKDYLFMEHTTHKPCFWIGRGEGRYDHQYFVYNVREFLLEKTPLFNFTIVSQSDWELILNFECPDGNLEINFQVVEDHLEISPKCSNPTYNRFWISIAANPNEVIYGCGQQFSELNLQGKKVPIWVQEKGFGRGDPVFQGSGEWWTTYYPQPTFISTMNYYCHVDTGYYSEFDFQEENSHNLSLWEVPKKIIIGKYNTALKVVENLSKYLGRQPKLPEWSYEGVTLGIHGGLGVVKQKLARARAYNVDVKGIWCEDWTGIRRVAYGQRNCWNWQYSENLYPNLPEYIKLLNSEGIKFLGYINPFLATEKPLYKEASRKGYLVKNQEGGIYMFKGSNFEYPLLDLTNPETCEWIKSIIKENLIGIGLSGWMLDFGEQLQADSILHSGEDPAEFHNKYPVKWAEINLTACEEVGARDILSFTRAGYSHISKYTMLHWAGDQIANWGKYDGLATVIPAGISLGLIGIGYYHFDIGGFLNWPPEIVRTKEMFMRWTELAVFTPFMRTHEGTRPRVEYDDIQFDYDDEILEHFGKMSHMHTHLKNYLLFLSNEYQERGIPLIRAMYLHYEDDPVVHELKYQFLLGRDLLVAPVYQPKSEWKKWSVYFPGGLWVSPWSGKEYGSEKGWREVDAPLGQPPVFYRKESKFSDLFLKLKDI